MNLKESVFVPRYDRAYCPEGYIIGEDGLLVIPDFNFIAENIKKEYLEDVNIINNHLAIHPGNILFLSTKKCEYIHAYDYHVGLTSGKCRISDWVYLHNLRTIIYHAYEEHNFSCGIFGHVKTLFNSIVRKIRLCIAEKLFVTLSEMEGCHFEYPTITERFLEEKKDEQKEARTNSGNQVYDKEASRELLECVTCENRKKGATGDCSTCPLNEDAKPKVQSGSKDGKRKYGKNKAEKK